MIIAIISHRATCAQLAGISTEISTWWVILHRFVSVGEFMRYISSKHPVTGIFGTIGHLIDIGQTTKAGVV